LLERQHFGPAHGGFFGGAELIRGQGIAFDGCDRVFTQIQRPTERLIVAGSIGAAVEDRGFEDHQAFGAHRQVFGDFFP